MIAFQSYLAVKSVDLFQDCVKMQFVDAFTVNSISLALIHCGQS